MIRRRLFLTLSAMVLLAGCASDFTRSYHRWDQYTATNGPYARWTLCIEQRSGFYLDPRIENGPARNAAAGNRGQLFANVLTDCRELMTGPAWSGLDDRQIRRLIDDAYQAFHRVETDIQAQMEASIT